MKTISTLIILCFFCFAHSQSSLKGFIENKGQIISQERKSNPAVKYLLNSKGLNVQLRSNGFSYDVYETKKTENTKTPSKDLLSNTSSEYIVTAHRIDINFENCNKNVKIIPEGKSKAYNNYYNIPGLPQGVTHVHGYEKVTYKNIYNNIDVTFFVPQDSSKPVEYNFTIHPGGTVSDIRMKFEGAKNSIENNKIVMQLRFGPMTETLPESWTENGDEKLPLTVNYKKIKPNTYGFITTGKIEGKTVVIDPVPTRLWGTFFGGEKDEYNLSLDKDAQGNAYTSGNTASKDFIATAGAHQSIFGSLPYYQPSLYITDGFVTKFDPSGARLWSTYYGGNNDDEVVDIAIAPNGNIGFCGNTYSDSNIATSDSFKNFKSGSYGEVFFGVLNTDGSRAWASYFADDSGRNFMKCILYDANGDMYIGGMTSSSNYVATANGFRNTPPSSVYNFDGFIAKFTGTGNRIWGSFYGGDKEDSIEDLVLDANNNVIAVGYTGSATNISTVGSFQDTLANSSGNHDGFMVSFAPSGARNWATYFGGSNTDKILRVKRFNDNLYICGETASNGLSTAGAFEPSLSFFSGATFVAKFNITQQQKVWLSYSSAKIKDIDINPLEQIYLAGESNYQTGGLATPDAFNPTNGGFVSYIRKIDNNCQIIWGTYLGNTGFIQNPKVRYIDTDVFYIAGNASTFFANDYGLSTPGADQVTSNGNYETYINKFRDCLSAATVSSNSPICIGGTVQLSASGGTTYNWTGPNGFTSTLPNPQIPLATTINSGQYTCTITGTGGCDGSNTITVQVKDTTKPVPNLAALPTITGDCSTAVTVIPTATDVCMGSIIGTTTDPLAYTLPGTYTIHWNFNDGNGNIETQNQTVTITAQPLPVANATQTFCVQQNATLANLSITGQNIKWYDAQTNGNLLPLTTQLTNNSFYYASQTLTSCESGRVAVQVSLQQTAAPSAQLTQTFCASQNPTLNDIAITGTNIIWYNTATANTVLPASVMITDGSTYYASQTVNGCESTGRTAVTVSLINSLPVPDFSKNICDEQNNGTETVNLSAYESEIVSGSSNYTFSYYYSRLGAENTNTADAIQNSTVFPLTLGINRVFARITSTIGCSKVISISLDLTPSPVISITDTVYFCKGGSITLNAGNGFDSYLWSNNSSQQTATITQPGNYWLKVTKNHGSTVCSTIKNFTVEVSEAATITAIDTRDWTSDENEIIVSTTGSGDYQYSIDGVNYQWSNRFTGLKTGAYTVYVKDNRGCGLSRESVFLLMYPKFFSPNGDGTNDTWAIRYAFSEPTLTVRIFDRYGKLITVLNHKSSWDGTLNGHNLPASDYWFVATRADGTEHKGHFSLIR